MKRVQRAKQGVKRPREGLAEALRADHARRAAVLEELLAAPVAARARIFAEFAACLRRHKAAEEQFVLPAFEKASGLRNGGPTALLRREHEQIERRLATIEGLLGEPDAGEQAGRELRALRAFLDDHERREDEVLHPTCEQLMGDAQRAAALRALRSRPRPGPAQR